MGVTDKNTKGKGKKGATYMVHGDLEWYLKVI